MATSDTQGSMFDGTVGTTARMPAPVYAYHIYKRQPNEHWRARYHQMIFGDPIPADEAVQRVASGLSCYVEANGLQSAIDQLAQLGVTVNKETPQTGRRGA